MKIFRIYSFSNIQICNAAVLTIVTKLYITFIFLILKFILIILSIINQLPTFSDYLYGS